MVTKSSEDYSYISCTDKEGEDALLHRYVAGSAPGRYQKLYPNKSSGIIVHPGIGVNSGTVANGLAYHFQKLSNINGDLRPGIVHRLDKDTSGVMVIAKTNSAHVFLADQFKERKVKKKYSGLTWGIWGNESGEINEPLSRDKKDPTKYSINANGKNSITKFEVKKIFRHSSLVSFFPLTGRTHQIRIHCSHHGHPIFGDEKYGGGISRSKGFIPESTLV